jgi:hypothetical protein
MSYGTWRAWKLPRSRVHDGAVAAPGRRKAHAMRPTVFIASAAAIVAAALPHHIAPGPASAPVVSSNSWMRVAPPAFTLSRSPVSQTGCVDPLAHVRRHA